MTSLSASISMPMKKVLSFGIISFIVEKDQIVYLLIQQHPKATGHWGFPKGRIELNETNEECARREFLEETGLPSDSVTLLPKLGLFVDKYIYTNRSQVTVDKTTSCFAGQVQAKHKDAVKIQKKEVCKYAWMNKEDALKRLTHDKTKKVFRQAVQKIEQFVSSSRSSLSPLSSSSLSVSSSSSSFSSINSSSSCVVPSSSSSCVSSTSSSSIETSSKKPQKLA
eukprot:TRINITY_DN363_c4_g1_i1.p1 TRINITY_DN363_c4_g1~~TRINITY_DN363_c4_g1_i1.p1  ORF type:complete len:237 (+),score=89.49 TRINITY_DN363_c4_g1_i1:42-713(+)